MKIKFIWAEALDWAPPIPGPRREGVSPPCRAHSAHALIHFPISKPQASPDKPYNNFLIPIVY